MQQKTCIRYLRFSSQGQSNCSIEWQDTNTAHWCNQNNVSIKDTFIDAGFSAKTFDRPDFENLSNFLTKHHAQVDYLVVNQMDRFSRDAGTALSLVKKLQDKYNVQIVSVSEGITYDHATPGSFFRTGLQLLLAEDDNINRAQKINSGIYTSKAKEGKYIGAAAPYGYKKTGTKKDMKLEIIEEEAAIIKFIYQSYRNLMPIMEIYRKACNMGLKKKGNSVIPKILANTIYSGQQLVKPWKDMPGGIFPANHPAIIDMITWQQTQAQLKGNEKNRVSICSEFPLRGVLHCHCGRLLTGSPSKGRHGGYFNYYKCQVSSKHNNISAKKAHAQLQEILGLMSLPMKIVERIKETTYKQIQQDDKSVKAEMAKSKKDMEETTRQLISLEEKWIKNQINFETYNRWHNDLNQQRQFINATIAKLSVESTTLLKHIDKNLSCLSDLPYWYNKLPISGQQAILRAGFDNSLYYNSGTYRTPFILPIFSHNLMIMSDKNLLKIDEKAGFLGKLPIGGAAGSRTLVQTYSP